MVGCEKSPEEKCFDAQMKAWDLKKPQRGIIHSEEKVFIDQQRVQLQHYANDLSGKANYEADAWARCMKR